MSFSVLKLFTFKQIFPKWYNVHSVPDTKIRQAKELFLKTIYKTD